MASRKRTERSALKRMALPVLSGTIIRPGQRIHVISPDEDPRFSDDLPNSVYGIPIPFELASTFLDDFLDIEHFSDEEAERLSLLLGTELTAQARSDLEVVSKRYISAIALADRLPRWKDYQKRVGEIDDLAAEVLDASRRLIKL